MDSLQISQIYFSHILNAQLVIFSVIVGALVSLYFFFNYKVSKNQIKNQIKLEIDKLKKDLEEKFYSDIEEKNKIASDQMSVDILRHEGTLNILSGEVYRTFGQFWDREKSYYVSFIWWMRAADKFFAAGDEKMTRITLNSAKNSIKSINYGYNINAEMIGEYQKILPNFDEGIYKIEKDSLDLEFKKALAREPEVSLKKT